MPSQMGGGSLLIALQLSGKKVLLVGGGEVAVQRIDSLLTSDVHITVLAPNDGVDSRIIKSMGQNPKRILLHRRQELKYDPDDMNLLKYDMVLTAVDNFELSRSICQFCREHRIPVNAADIPELCDFYFGSTIRDGPLQILVSTNGSAPRLASLVKKKVAQALSGNEGAALERVGSLRAQLKERAPGVGGGIGKRRMAWMTKLCNEWSMKELGMLNEESTRKLLDEWWEKDQVPSPRAIGVRTRWEMPSLLPLFHGIIGFSVGAAFTSFVYISQRQK